MLLDHAWAAQVSEVMRSDYFDLKYLAFLVEKYLAYHKKYKVFPPLATLITSIKDELREPSNEALKTSVVDYLTRIRSSGEPPDGQFVRDKALDFCKRQAMREALEKSIDLISSNKYDAVLELMKKAVSSGMSDSVGHDFFEDREARFIEAVRSPCPTGIEQLDDRLILNGGLGKGELGCVVGATGAGKSHILVMLGANAMRVGKNVVHYTLELSEAAVGIRYDSNLTGVPASDVRDQKDQVLKSYDDMELGRLVIKQYPPRVASAQTIRLHLEKLALRGFTPHVVIVDYADIMRSSHEHELLRLELQLVYEELRALAVEKNIPIWTASQGNRSSASADVIGLENMSESYGKAMTADVVVSLSRKPTEKSTGAGRFFLAKNRAGKDGILFPVHIDTSRSRMTFLQEESQGLGDALKSDEMDRQRIIRDKWKQVTENMRIK